MAPKCRVLDCHFRQGEGRGKECMGSIPSSIITIVVIEWYKLAQYRRPYVEKVQTFLFCYLQSVDTCTWKHQEMSFWCGAHSCIFTKEESVGNPLTLIPYESLDSQLSVNLMKMGGCTDNCVDHFDSAVVKVCRTVFMHLQHNKEHHVRSLIILHMYKLECRADALFFAMVFWLNCFLWSCPNWILFNISS
jgi:hypothetical protein